jgi:hypothetical protein
MIKSLPVMANAIKIVCQKKSSIEEIATSQESESFEDLFIVTVKVQKPLSFISKASGQGCL